MVMTQEHNTYFVRSRLHLPHAVEEVESAPTFCRINYININGFKWKWKKITYSKILYNNLHQTFKPFSTHTSEIKKWINVKNVTYVLVTQPFEFYLIIPLNFSKKINYVFSLYRNVCFDNIVIWMLLNHSSKFFNEDKLCI